MDPLSALSVATSVLQIIDFGTKLVATTKEFYKVGASIQTGDLLAKALEIKAVSESLKEYLDRPTVKNTGPVSEAEQALNELVTRVYAAAQELDASLDSIASKSKNHKWRSVQATMRSVWAHDKLKYMEQHLNGLRSLLGPRLLAVLNAKLDAQSKFLETKLDQLAECNNEIINVISLNHNTLISTLKAQGPSVGQTQQDVDESFQQQNAEIITAILTLRSGCKIVLSPPPIQANTQQTLQTTFPPTLMTLSSSTDGISSDPLLSDFDTVERLILDCLYFRRIKDRLHDISEAQKRTFEWIFHSPTENQKFWDDFVAWLETSNGCYWMNGKAGSGKSTLFKFIHQHPRLMDALSKWAHDGTLIVASYFMWNPGSDLQKSQLGLLRTILYDIIRQCPSLIPLAFPEMCRIAARLTSRQTLAEPTLSELMSAFRNILNQKKLPVRICLLVDGIDEYEGDPVDVADLLASVASDNLKIILSSRPIPACIRAFSKFPSLRLQDLTHNDIKQCIDDKLLGSPGMKELIENDKDGTKQLITNLTQKACGVFLWITVVIRSLLQGLENMDSVQDLMNLLEELPTELEDLYDHMISNMPKSYRHQASQIFQMAVLSQDVQEDEALSAVQLSFASDEELPAALTRTPGQLEWKEVMTRSKMIEARLRSRCCGLLEVRKDHLMVEVGYYDWPYVTYFHKTVYEYLQDPKRWEKILDMASGSDFDPAISLMASSLSIIKVLPTSKHIDIRLHAPWLSMRHCFQYAQNARDSNHVKSAQYLQELDRIMSYHWNAADRWNDGTRGSKRTFGHWSCSEPRTSIHLLTKMSEEPPRHSSFSSLAVKYRLPLFLEDFFTSNSNRTIGEHGHELLAECLEDFFIEESLEQVATIARIMDALFHCGADTNHSDGESLSPWQMALKKAASMSSESTDHSEFLLDFDRHGRAELFINLLISFILAGSSPNTKLLLPSGEERSALSILHSLLSQSLHEKYWLRGSSRRRPLNRVRGLQELHDIVMDLLLDHGAMKDESVFAD